MLVDMKRWFRDLTSAVRGEGIFELAGGSWRMTPCLIWGGWWLDIGGLEKRMKKNAEELDGIVGGWLAEHKEKEYSGENQKPEDFMDVMLSVVQSAELQAQYDADTIIKATCLVLISGGSDTTAVMLVWALSLLLNNRRVLKKAQEELDKHFGRERQPYRGLPYPEGTWLIVNLWKLQRDPNVWPDGPLEFRPERFLSKGKNVDVKGHDFELIPFGAGRRICTGVKLGLQMLHLVLANLLHAFEVSTVSDEMVDMSESAGLTNMKATPLDVLVAPRLSPTLYT
ncbi:UNVERIFIED_CONTAM: cytochrome [Sesamum radiatum]|uniref:Cytochrome n=1 Tax=Sesamum radiatum TaxID=300843 RepID=A0AAW2RDB8_SESRA